VVVESGEALVLYRDASGVPALLSDRCPHRFASLADGRVRSDGRIACPYHGWNFDRAGCGKSPTQPERTDCDTAAYMVEERDGLLWVAPRGAKAEELVAGTTPILPLGTWRRRAARGLLRKRPEFPDELVFPVALPSGEVHFRTFVVRERLAETPDIVSWVLAPKDQKPVGAHRPGQHVTVRTPGLGKLLRSYSLSAPPNGESLRISVRRVPTEGRGIASKHLHQYLQVGAEIELSSPAGEFCLPEQDRPAVFIAAGVGITPLFCMLKARQLQQRTAPAWLFYGVRAIDDVFRAEELRSLAASGVHVQLFVSGAFDAKPDADVLRWKRGRVGVEAIADVLAAQPDVFLCGPDEMMSSFEAELLRNGLPKERIHAERFVRSSAIAEAAKTLKPAKVTFTKSNRELSWSQQSGTLLELAVNAGIALDSGCEVGSCSTCKVQVLKGEFLTVGKARESELLGGCLVCVSVPTGDLVLDA
jgi:ferredoxin-NADP reductase/nitrite reductase/ring-hydroxylating ferredoxin subunit